MQFRLVTTRNKKEQQQDAKSNADLCFVTNYRPNVRIRLGSPLNRLLEKAEANLFRPDP